jgi:hypothetical protein
MNGLTPVQKLVSTYLKQFSNTVQAEGEKVTGTVQQDTIRILLKFFV